jgi:hypothetical protein
MNNENMSYTAWYRSLNHTFAIATGVTLEDIEDQDYLSMYEDGFTVDDAMNEIFEYIDIYEYAEG